jgi:hypothetical protein
MMDPDQHLVSNQHPLASLPQIKVRLKCILKSVSFKNDYICKYICKIQIDAQFSNPCPICTSQTSVPETYVLFFKFSIWHPILKSMSFLKFANRRPIIKSMAISNFLKLTSLTQPIYLLGLWLG